MRSVDFLVMPRARSFAVWLMAVVVFVAGLVWCLEVVQKVKPNLFYQGRPLEYWFNQLPMTRTVGQSRRMVMRSPSGAVRKYGDWVETPEASAKAIRGIGTNALAFYLGKLTRHYGPIERSLGSVERWVGFHGFSFAEINAEREQAATALILLKPLPSSVVSNLVTLSANRSGEIAAAAHCALETRANDLVTLHSPSRKQALDLDLLNLPKLSDGK